MSPLWEGFVLGFAAASAVAVIVIGMLLRP